MVKSYHKVGYLIIFKEGINIAAYIISAFAGGIFLGGMLGAVVMACCAAAGQDDLMNGRK